MSGISIPFMVSSSSDMLRLLCLCVPFAGGCFMYDVTSPVYGTSTSAWYEISPVTKPFPEVLEAVREAVRHSGFVVLPSDRADRFSSDWLVELSSHWREGFRTKIEAEIVQLEQGRLKVRVRGVREVNDDEHNPSSALSAHWINASLDDKQKDRIPEYVIRVHQLLKFKFVGNP